jgi:hypothetical protein
MIQKHKMTADFEKAFYSRDMLKHCWDEQLEYFTTLTKSGWTHFSILDFIRYIQTTIYATILFPGSSLGTLLISKPKDGYLNYQQTLAISFDRTTELFTLQYSDWDLIESADDSAKAILWTVKCPGIELGQKFLDFLKWKKNWC